MFKYQHDTDKDLKYLHVFPNVDLSAAEAEAGGGGGEAGGGGGGGGPQSPEYQCVSCTLEEFQDLVAMNVPSFSQKRALLKRLRARSGGGGGGGRPFGPFGHSVHSQPRFTRLHTSSTPISHRPFLSKRTLLCGGVSEHILNLTCRDEYALRSAARARDLNVLRARRRRMKNGMRACSKQTEVTPAGG